MSDEIRPAEGKAIVMREHGPPAVLHLETVPLADLAPDEIRIRSIASAVNHSDLQIRAGHWTIRKPEPFPYIPGLEVLGEIVETGAAVLEFRPGDRVVTMMQGLGGVRAERPGGYAQYVTVRASAAAPVAPDLDPYDMAALGLGSVTAYEGLRRLGPLEGRRIAITGASGGVGSAGISIARAQGAEVVAVISRPEHDAYVRALGATETMLFHNVANGALGAESVDGILDAVAGDAFDTFVKALRRGATLSLVGAIGGNQVSFDAYRLLDTTLTGYSSENLDGPSLRRAVGAIADWLRKGALEPPERTQLPLHEAARAHESLERHAVRGRVLLVPETA